MLSANSFSSYGASQFMETQRDRQPLFARHLLVKEDLRANCFSRRHAAIIGTWATAGDGFSG
jgi:hypothetical protein